MDNYNEDPILEYFNNMEYLAEQDQDIDLTQLEMEVV